MGQVVMVGSRHTNVKLFSYWLLYDRQREKAIIEVRNEMKKI